MGDKVWLLSFADLAFLFLIAHSQIATVNQDNLGELTPPVVERSTAKPLSTNVDSAWKLVILAPNSEDGTFELWPPVGSDAKRFRFGQEEIVDRLRDLQKLEAAPPLLVPSPEGLAHDLILAHSSVLEVWQDAQGETVVSRRSRNTDSATERDGRSTKQP